MAAARIEAVLGDITTEDVDAIVNAANQDLAQGGGVCGAIFAAAGARELAAACATLGGCPSGDAKATDGFALPARWIVHTVGPVWRGGADGEDETLASCYRRSIDVATGVGARSLAFPAISTGIYGFPPDRAAGIAVRTVVAAASASAVAERVGLDLVRLVAFDRPTFARYQQLLEPRSPAAPPKPGPPGPRTPLRNTPPC
jgi:O-acetyl-ADP-ribose deacetylase